MYVMYHRRSSPTGRKLGRLLGLQRATAERLPAGADVLLRWGTAQRRDVQALIQPADAVALAGNKLRALERMRERDVRTPEFSTDPSTLGTEFIMCRSLRGFGGTDIRVVNASEGSFLQAEFYTGYIPNRWEARIHVFDGEVIRVQKKYLDFPEQHTCEYVKNYAQGYRFRTPQRKLNRERLDAATSAVAALGLTFGAVDLIVGQDNRSYVLEVNTAPKLAPLTAQQYAQAIQRKAAELGHTLTINEDALEAFTCDD